jgi:hypothetical protein
MGDGGGFGSVRFGILGRCIGMLDVMDITLLETFTTGFQG